MQGIDLMRARVHATGDLADIFGAAWDAFELVQRAADRYAERAPELFAAFMLAAASATQGRDAIGFAPSMPGGPGLPIGQMASADSNAYTIADDLAGLVAMLGRRLQAAVGQARDPRDQWACEQAIWAAGQIGELLAPARR